MKTNDGKENKEECDAGQNEGSAGKEVMGNKKAKKIAADENKIVVSLQRLTEEAKKKNKLLQQFNSILMFSNASNAAIDDPIAQEFFRLSKESALRELRLQARAGDNVNSDLSNCASSDFPASDFNEESGNENELSELLEGDNASH
jgi:hypothetical protein